jgi:hypothetical protein
MPCTSPASMGCALPTAPCGPTCSVSTAHSGGGGQDPASCRRPASRRPRPPVRPGRRFPDLRRNRSNHPRPANRLLPYPGSPPRFRRPTTHERRPRPAEPRPWKAAMTSGQMNSPRTRPLSRRQSGLQRLRRAFRLPRIGRRGKSRPQPVRTCSISTTSMTGPSARRGGPSRRSHGGKPAGNADPVDRWRAAVRPTARGGSRTRTPCGTGT